MQLQHELIWIDIDIWIYYLMIDYMIILGLGCLAWLLQYGGLRL